MERPGRRVLLILAWFATAIAAGILAAWWFRQSPPTVIRTIVVEAPAPGPGPGAGATGVHGPEAVGPRQRVVEKIFSSSSGPDDQSSVVHAEPDARPLVVSLQVTVEGADGGPAVEGSVYALGPGEPGRDDGDALGCVEIHPPAHAVLRVPGPGLYDIGYRGREGATLQPNVAVAADGTTRVALRLPAGLPISFRCEGGWPPEGAEVLANVDVRYDDGDGDTLFPGRGQTSGRAEGTATLGPAGEGATRPLPPDRDYDIRTLVRERRRDAAPGTPEAEWKVSSRFSLVADRETARPGETVTLRLRRMAAVEVTIETEGFPDAEAEVAAWLDLHAAGGRKREVPRARRRSGTSAKPGEGAADPLRGTCRFSVEPGRAALRWSGRGVRAGALEGIDLRAGEIERVTIVLRPDPDGKDPPDAHVLPTPVEPPTPEVEVPVEVSGLPANWEGTASVWGVKVDEASGDVSCTGADLDGPGPHTLPGAFRNCRSVVAIAGDALASEPATVPASGSVVVAFKPAGILVVVPEEEVPPDVGDLVLRLPGGRLFPVDGSPQVSADVETGARIGPLPAGSYTFEVRLGGVRLPDATATVRAGRLEVLRVRLRRE